MSKTVGASLKSHFAQEVTTLAVLWKLTLTDATVMGFTSHDTDLTVGGVTYAADTGAYRPTSVASSGDLSVDNLEVDTVLDAAAITEADLMAGVYDGATVEIMVCNYADLTQGSMTLRTGTLGEVSVRTGTATVELRGMAQAFQQTVGRVCMRRCDADFGDSRCGVSLASYTVTGTVLSVDTSNNRVIEVDTLPSAAGGLLTWTSGANNGREMEVVDLSSPYLGLFEAMGATIAPGDTYSVTAGCDRNLSTCRDTYNNVINFRGFPDIPGLDKVLQTPNAH